MTDGIAEVREHSVVDRDGVEREVDTIILGTGFHVTDLPIAERVRGRDGRTLAEHWDGSPQALPRHDRRRLPEPVLRCSGRTPASATPRWCCMAEAQAGYIRQALEHMRRARASRRSSRGRRRRSACNAEIQRKLAGHGLDRRRLRELVHRPQRPQHDAVAGLHVHASSRQTAQLRRRRVPTLPAPASRPTRRPRWRMSKRVLITGAASGIGAATAAELRARGCDRRRPRPATPSGDDVIACDVRDQASVDARRRRRRSSGSAGSTC